MTSKPPALLIDADGLHRYESWRRQWRNGAQNQAIAMLCHHGMVRALQLTALLTPPPPRPAAMKASSDLPPLSECAAVTRQAGRMIHELLVHEAGERHHA